MLSKILNFFPSVPSLKIQDWTDSSLRSLLAFSSHGVLSLSLWHLLNYLAHTWWGGRWIWISPWPGRPKIANLCSNKLLRHCVYWRQVLGSFVSPCRVSPSFLMSRWRRLHRCLWSLLFSCSCGQGCQQLCSERDGLLGRQLRGCSL